MPSSSTGRQTSDVEPISSHDLPKSSSSPRLISSDSNSTIDVQESGALPRKKDQVTTLKKFKRLAYGPNYIPEEETIRNDYSLHYVGTGSRPQNHIQNTGLATRFAEYPKLKKLLELKQAVVAGHAHPPTYLEADLRPSHPNGFNLLDLHPSRFDVIVLDPPLMEYADSYPHISATPPNSTCGGPIESERPWWSWDELEALPVPQIAASPGFIFLWCGTGQGKGLEQGRALLTKWGYRKCEDLVWVKTNHTRTGPTGDIDCPEHGPKTKTVFTPTKEHCLMGIRGTVRRSTDGHFVHCNVDTDVIVAEADSTDPLHKPIELYHLIENFCLGHRRLELFGSKHSLRRGWLTIGNQCAPGEPLDTDESAPLVDRPIPYVKEHYVSHFLEAGRTQNLLPTTAEIESLRPRSPPGRLGPSLAGPSGSPLPRGLGLGMSVPGSNVHSNHSGAIGAPISGRNTISHPSGGLGRGPGNALLPGMRVSGFRDSGNAPVPGSAAFKKPQSIPNSRGRDYKSPQANFQNHQHMSRNLRYPLPFQTQVYPGHVGGPGDMSFIHAGGLAPHMMPSHSDPMWSSPQFASNGYPYSQMGNQAGITYPTMHGMMQYPNPAYQQMMFGPQAGGSRTPSGSTYSGQTDPHLRDYSPISPMGHSQPFQPGMYPSPHPHPQSFTPPPLFQPSPLQSSYHTYPSQVSAQRPVFQTHTTYPSGYPAHQAQSWSGQAQHPARPGDGT